jgi:phage terminase large subunit-like protein
VLDKGDKEDVLQFGPIKVTAECRSGQVALRLHIEWDDDLFVFGDIDDDENLNNDPISNFVLSSSTSYSADMWDVTAKKGDNDPDVGAAWVTDGSEVWYLGLDGDSMIGIGENDDLSDSSDITDIIDDDTECLIAGGLNYYSGDD